MKLNELLRDVAPTIAGAVGTAIGGPLGPMAAVGLKMLSEHLLGKPDATPAEIEEVVSKLPPEQLLELRRIDRTFKIRMVELGFKPMELENADRADARKMQTAALGSTSRLAQEFIYWYAIFWSIWAALYITWITIMPVPQENLRVVDTVLGFILGTLIATLLAFFFGTSYAERGARKREDISVRTVKETP